MADPKKVFVVYGRNTKAASAMKTFLQALKLEAIDFYELSSSEGGSEFVGKIVRSGMDKAGAVVVLMTPDEAAALRPELRRPSDKTEETHRWQARPNVIFEAGMALGIDEKRTILVTLGDVALASDLAGRHEVRLNNRREQRNFLRMKLEGVGCAVDMRTTDWLDAGDFEACIATFEEVVVPDPFRVRRS